MNYSQIQMEQGRWKHVKERGVEEEEIGGGKREKETRKGEERKKGEKMGKKEVKNKRGLEGSNEQLKSVL